MAFQDDTGLDSLKLLVDQLRLTRNLLDQDSPVEAKVAIILLDSMADSLMYRRCRSEFSWDQFTASVRRPRFSAPKRSQALRDFKGKVNVLCDIKFLSPEDATILKIAHSYRNAAYHRDIHNQRVTREIGRLVFISVCNVVKSFYTNGISQGGFAPQTWLADYGLRTDFVDFGSAARTIVAHLVKGISTSLTISRLEFEEDVRLRLNKIDEALDKLPNWCIGAKLDEGLKWAEFSDEHPSEEFYGELWDLNYEIASGNGVLVNRTDYDNTASRAEFLREQSFAGFVPVCSARLLNHLKTDSRINDAKSVAALLSAYQEIDSKLSRFESSIEDIARSIEEATQIEDDIRRGK